MARRKRLRKNTPLQSLPDFRSGVSTEEKQDLTRRERGERKERGKRILAGLATLLVLLAGGLWLQSARVSTIAVEVLEGQGAIALPSTDTVTNSVESYLNESALNRWLVDHDRLAEIIRAENQDVAAIDRIEQESGSILVVVAPRERAVIWQKGSDYYEVDSSGVAYQSTTEELVAGNVHVLDQSSLPVVVGEPVASSNVIDHIVNLIRATDSIEQIKIESFISPNAAREVHIRLAGAPYIVKTTIDQSADVVAASLRDTLQFFTEQKVTPSQVIDLRVSGKAIYR